MYGLDTGGQAIFNIFSLLFHKSVEEPLGHLSNIMLHSYKEVEVGISTNFQTSEGIRINQPPGYLLTQHVSQCILTEASRIYVD